MAFWQRTAPVPMSPMSGKKFHIIDPRTLVILTLVALAVVGLIITLLMFQAKGSSSEIASKQNQDLTTQQLPPGVQLVNTELSSTQPAASTEVGTLVDTEAAWSVVHNVLQESPARLGQNPAPVTSSAVEDPYAIQSWDQLLRYSARQQGILPQQFTVFPNRHAETTISEENGNPVVEIQGSVRLIYSVGTTLTEREEHFSCS